MIRYNFSGADVSAYWFDLRVFESRKRHERRFAQSDAGLAELEAFLCQLGVKRLWIAIEHTGGYERRLAEFLYARGHRVCLVDGLQVLRYKQSLKVRAKTDKVDADVLARFARDRRPAPWAPRHDPYRRLTELVHHRQALVDDITAWKNRRSSPHSDEFVNAQQNTLIEVLTLQLEEVQLEIARLVDADPDLTLDVALMCTVKGVKFTSATSFLAESGPMSAYPTPRSLALAAGLVPLPYQSGCSITKGKPRPYGNERMRRALCIIAPCARKHNPALACFAGRIAAKGNKPNALLNRAVMRKMTHIFWGVLTRREPFDPEKAVWKYQPKRD